MSKKTLALAATLFAFSLAAQASILTSEAGDKKIETINVAKSGTVTLNNQDIKVDVLGAGLRQKKVLVVNVKVYVAELFASDAGKFVRTSAEALKSLDLSRTIAIRLNFLRAVEADKVQVSFRDALSANQVKLDDPSIQAFLAAVTAGGEASEGKALTIVAQKNADGTESVVYENTKGETKSITGGAGFSKNVMAIWLGTPSDDGVAKLKDQLIKGL